MLMWSDGCLAGFGPVFPAAFAPAFAVGFAAAREALRAAPAGLAGLVAVFLAGIARSPPVSS
jgi:hypothetical protein